MTKNNRKTKLVTAAVVAATGVSSLLNTSCENKTDNVKDLETIKKELKIKEDSVKKAKEHEKEVYIQHAIDSIKKENGYAEYAEELYSLPNSYGDQSKIRDIEFSKTLRGTMDREFEKSSEKPIKDFYKNACALLEKYGLGGPELYQEDLIWAFGDLDTKNIEASYHIGEMPVLSMYYEPITESDFGHTRQKEIKDKMDALVIKAAKHVQTIKQDIDKRYADYILEDGSGLYDGDANNFMIVKKSVSVYDQNLDMDFFGEDGAKYELVSLNGGKWQVLKTRKNGKIEKTHVFQDNKDFEESKTFVKENNNKVGDTDLKFSAGKNKGVRVEFSKIVKIKKRKLWKPVEYTKEEQKTIDSLTNQIKYKERLDSLLTDAAKKAEVKAKELAKIRFKSTAYNGGRKS